MPKRKLALSKRKDLLPALPDAAGGAPALRERILAKAGLTEDRLAENLRLAEGKLRDLLEARRPERVVYQGAVTAQYEDADGALQLAAARELLDLAGAKPSKFANTQTSGPQVVILVQGRDPEPAQVKAEVIEADAGP